MQLSIMDLLHDQLRQIEFLASEISEAVIILDSYDMIVWANAAALEMHRADDLAGLGHTIDDYHANFQIRYRSLRKPSAQNRLADVAVERLRDSLIEITPHGGEQPALHRLRKLAVPAESNRPRYTVLIITPMPQSDAGQGSVLLSISEAAGPTAIIRCSDGALLEQNVAFRELAHNVLSENDVSDMGTELAALVELPEIVRDNIASGASFPFTLAKFKQNAAEGKPALISGQQADYNGERSMVLTILKWDTFQALTREAAGLDADSLQTFATALCEVMPGLGQVVDAEMRLVSTGAAWLEGLGFARGAALGRKITDFMTANAAAAFQAITWPAILAGGTVRDITCQFVNSAGNPVDHTLSAAADLNDNGGIRLAVLAMTNATEKQRAADGFIKLMAISPTPLVIRRLEDNRILDANDAFTNLTGFANTAVIGHCGEEFWSLTHKQSRANMEQDLRAGKRVRDLDVKLKTSFGDSLDAILAAESIQMFGQNCALMAFQDVTDRRRSEAELFEAIETVMEDTTWFTQSVIEKIAALRRPSRPGIAAPEIGDLTPREREVLGFISHGMTDRDIAEKLGLTRCTVRNHVATLYSKIGVHSRSSAIVWARERGVNLSWPVRSPANFMRDAAAHRRNGAPTKVRGT